MLCQETTLQGLEERGADGDRRRGNKKKTKTQNGSEGTLFKDESL